MLCRLQELLRLVAVACAESPSPLLLQLPPLVVSAQQPHGRPAVAGDNRAAAAAAAAGGGGFDFALGTDSVQGNSGMEK